MVSSENGGSPYDATPGTLDISTPALSEVNCGNFLVFNETPNAQSITLEENSLPDTERSNMSEESLINTSVLRDKYVSVNFVAKDDIKQQDVTRILKDIRIKNLK